jgi:hypothetical protein
MKARAKEEDLNESASMSVAWIAASWPTILIIPKVSGTATVTSDIDEILLNHEGRRTGAAPDAEAGRWAGRKVNRQSARAEHRPAAMATRYSR